MDKEWVLRQETTHWKAVSGEKRNTPLFMGLNVAVRPESGQKAVAPARHGATWEVRAMLSIYSPATCLLSELGFAEMSQPDPMTKPAVAV